MELLKEFQQFMYYFPFSLWMNTMSRYMNSWYNATITHQLWWKQIQNCTNLWRNFFEVCNVKTNFHSWITSSNSTETINIKLLHQCRWYTKPQLSDAYYEKDHLNLQFASPFISHYPIIWNLLLLTGLHRHSWLKKHNTGWVDLDAFCNQKPLIVKASEKRLLVINTATARNHW